MASFGIFSKQHFAGVDQGVDYSGAGIIPALDNALITDVGTTHIVEEPGKVYNYVIYMLRTGPYKGHFVYTAENFHPIVHRGQTIKKGAAIGRAEGHYPYIETGFNKSEQGWDAYGDLGGPQPAGYAMKDYIDSILGTHPKISNADERASNVTTGGATPNKIASGIKNAVFGGVEGLILQGFFIMVGIGLVLVGLGLVAWSVLGRTGGVVGAVQTQMRINQAGERTIESGRAAQVRESQASERISQHKAAGERAERRLQVTEGNLGRRSERYVVKDKPNQVVRGKPGKPATGVPR